MTRALWLGVGMLALACGDPAIDRPIEALGPEVAGVEKGETHRPGQPCVLCHSSRGPGSPEFTVGGTVYRELDDPRPIEGVQVDLIDSAGDRFQAFTNCAGNFYVSKGDWDPSFPIWTTLNFGDNIEHQMETAIERDGSCASCHVGSPSQTSAGRVFLNETPFDGGQSGGCR